MSESFKAEGSDFPNKHLEAYLKTDGKHGHLADFAAFGGPPDVPCLILETTGRKSGKKSLLPLIYGKDGENFVIIASKGGAPTHPVWYLNLDADPDVKIQVVDKKYTAKAVLAPAADRQRLYDMMSKIFPPYIKYQQITDREIPVVLLKPETEIDHLG
jgi:deazaflavin-dependent oxidoreductase (nitroreductase family)